MKNLLILFSVFYLVVFSVFGQGNVLYYEVQQAKKSNVYFEKGILTEAGIEVELLKKFINPDEVSFLGNISLDVKNNNVKAMNLVVPTKNKNIILELIEVSESFYDYEVITSDGIKSPANKEIKHYRGVIKDEVNSLVAITFYEDEIIGLISTDEGNFNIVKDVLSGKHVFYNDKNLKDKMYPICNTTDDMSFSYKPEVLFKPRSNEQKAVVQDRAINKMVKFYVETEYDIYQAKGSVLSVEAFISGLFSQVAVLYQNEDILTRISTIYVWTTNNDPYTSTNTGALLNQFQNTRTSFNGDLGILLTFRNVGGGQAAGFNGLCNSSTGQKLAVAMLYNDYSIVPSYSWSVMVVTHELGHLFGSRHTHACVWNGNNTAIDGCAGGVEGSCSLPGYPSAGGTMMSYCHLSGRPGINFSLGFGPQPGNVIRNSVINASCLQVLCNSTVNFTNQTVITNQTVTSPCNIYTKNVTVGNNAKLILDAGNETTIDGAFEVQLGSQLEVK